MLHSSVRTTLVYTDAIFRHFHDVITEFDCILFITNLSFGDILNRKLVKCIAMESKDKQKATSAILFRAFRLLCAATFEFSKTHVGLLKTAPKQRKEPRHFRLYSGWL